MAQNQHGVPFVIERTGRGERSYDIYSRLLRDRIVFVGGQIDDDLANCVMAQLLFLSNDDPKADVNLYVNTVGGRISAGLAIYDTMQFVRCDVCTFCVGMAASLGSLLLAAGKAGKRYILPNSRVLIHQPLIRGVLTGAATELDIEAREIIRLKKRLYEIFSEHTGQTVQQIEQDCDRNKWLNAEEAVEYGCADQVLQRMPEAMAHQTEEK